MTGTKAPGRVSSVSEIQAALRAVRAGQFADASATSTLPVERAPATPPPAAAPNSPPPMPSASMPSAPTPPPVLPGRGDSGGSGDSGVWLLGTHGGSGARRLSAVLPGTRCAGRAWPSSCSSRRESRREQVVLVCRANHRGLTAAQDYARAYRDEGLAERLQLLGVIVSADAPGRMPTALRRLERLLSGAVPILGHAPWEATWRLGPPVATGEPLPWLAKLGESLRAAVEVAS